MNVTEATMQISGNYGRLRLVLSVTVNLFAARELITLGAQFITDSEWLQNVHARKRIQNPRTSVPKGKHPRPTKGVHSCI